MEKQKKPLFTASDKIKHEYCAKIVRIGEMKPIENSDFLVQTIVDGNSIVISKGMFEVGEPVIYCMNETQINKDFLSANNQFEIGEYEMNSNAKEVASLIEEGKEDEAKKLVGFFNKHGRVKLIRLRGCPSYGCIFKKESLAIWNKRFARENLEEYLTVDENGYEHPFDFDTVDGKLFAQAYVPPLPSRVNSGVNKRDKLAERFDRLIPGQFVKMYDTEQLQSNMWRFNPETEVSITVKQHGTSIILANVLTRIPIKLSFFQAGKNKKIKREIKTIQKQYRRFYWEKQNDMKRLSKLQEDIVKDFRIDYGPIYSSRTVIKNQYINKGVTPGFYGVDIWSEYGDLMKPFIPKGVTVYGEICGYLTGSSRMVQKEYDYGCEQGENFLMPYRITYTDPEGNKTEWDVEEVYGWTLKLINEHPELAKRVKPLTILYKGTLGDLYPDIDKAEHWNENVLEAMKNDKEHFGMEENEPLCKKKVPREGIVVRINGDQMGEAWKLKTFKFLEREKGLMDKNQVDIEMADNYGQE